MTHDEFQKLASAGSPTTPEEAEAVREHVARCPECLSIESAGTPDATNGRAASWWLAIVAIFFLALWIWREAGIRVARERLRGERAEVVELMNAEKVLRDQKGKLADDLAVISAPGAQVIALAGGPVAASASGKLYVDAARHRAVLVAIGLAESGADIDYQLWLYGPDGTAPRSGGIFDVTNGHTTLSVADVPPSLKSVAVTVEKNGGATQPSAAVVLAGHP
jgi:Anti-sigma-K factor rskA